jgi:CBS domain containing-hemolysin-like protein
MSSSDQSATGGDRPGLFDRLKSLFGFQGASVREDIEDALEEAAPGADISPQERLLLKNVLNLHDLRVADIMVPRADIISVNQDATLGEVLSIFRTAGHSRVPVYAETLDDPRGMIHIRDFVDYMARAAENRTRLRINSATDTKPELAKLAGLSGIDLNIPLNAAKILRPVLFTPPSMPALDLLVRMQATRTHIALVIDEYGGTDGLVSIEDIVETIVGDIEDEHDLDETPVIERQADGSLIMDARASLEEVREALGEDLSIEMEEEIDTIGGLVSTLAGQLPTRGEIVRISDTLECEVLDADPRRVKKVRLRKTDSAASA